MIKIKKGLELPISGAPVQEITDSPKISSCAVLGQDYIGLKPTMAVKEGELVKAGQVLFSDKRNTSLRVVAPISGKVSAINRGQKRVLLSLVIEGGPANESLDFTKYTAEQAQALSTATVKEALVESGLWAALRRRPFGTVPSAEETPAAIFVTAMDTHPLSANPEVVIAMQQEEFNLGLHIVKKLTEGKVYLCTKPGESSSVPGIEHATFDGPHPAGLVGTHIHFLCPVSEQKSVWHIGYQDVIALGHLFLTGEYSSMRVVALAGPQVKKPRLVKLPIGAKLASVVDGQALEGENRIVSGSVLGGVHGRGVKGYLSRYHQQITVLLEGRERGFLEYLSPGAEKHSVANIYLSKFANALRLPMTTSTNGSQRAMVPIGIYEKVVPLDILPTQLLRALIVGDIESAIELGALELEEEDLALCTYVCPGKYEYGPILRDNLRRIEQEG